MCAESNCNVCKCASELVAQQEALTRQKGSCLLSLPTRDARLGNGGSSCARTVSFVSSKASTTRLDDRAMEIIDVEACRRSRYRSLYFYCKSLTDDDTSTILRTRP